MLSLVKIQGRNQVCSQRWARLEHFPFHNFFPIEISILAHPKQILVVSKSDKQKKSALLIFIPFPFHLQFPFFSLSIFPVSLPLFSFLSSFSLSLPFFLLFPFLPKFFPNFPRVGDSPTLPTSCYATVKISIGL